ncbi:hypothetical protein OO013_10550 [Mangrovivirga sp. M17]|uniref:Uncharacterized protein n=1 Tax=Mangrovivirga halotolerans TaxID=2993936 RepID=A0ABT3RSI1_9BACT|nr:hypothetical protein [Mangrovivirga halotolerans]MCX2744309.1 hypothetical protein [Mangrovivirga halotolerans]
MEDIKTAINKATKWMDEYEGVEGVAEGNKGGRQCITVFVSNEEIKNKLPKEVDGYPVKVEVTDSFNAIDDKL